MKASTSSQKTFNTIRPLWHHSLLHHRDSCLHNGHGRH